MLHNHGVLVPVHFPREKKRQSFQQKTTGNHCVLALCNYKSLYRVEDESLEKFQRTNLVRVGVRCHKCNWAAHGLAVHISVWSSERKKKMLNCYLLKLLLHCCLNLLYGSYCCAAFLLRFFFFLGFEFFCALYARVKVKNFFFISQELPKSDTAGN